MSSILTAGDSLVELAFWTPGPAELVIILIIALLLFGKRLPDVMRSMGRGVVEFKKGIPRRGAHSLFRFEVPATGWQ